MNELELKEKVYEGVLTLAFSMVRQKKTMTSSELTDWINKTRTIQVSNILMATRAECHKQHSAGQRIPTTKKPCMPL